jgi:hypothetical protein
MIALKDQDCQTKAPSADFFVSTMGELMRNGEDLSLCGSINLGELANRLGFDWSKVCMYRKPSECAEARRWFAAIDAEWETRYKATLTRKEYNFLKKVFAFQKNVPEGRFRVYGEIRNGKPRIVVVTEFIGCVEDDAYWTRFDAVVKKLKAHVWIMSEDENTEYSYRLEGDKKVDEKFGPNYGKVERQVELSWRIEKLTIPDLKALLVNICNVTRKLWKESGVGVI